MKRFLFRMLPVATALCLSGCAQTPRPATSAAPKVQAIGNAQQLSDAIAALEAGDEKRARKLLKRMAARDPADRRVAVLRESIEGDPVALLGAKSFGYSLQRSDSMMTLAQRFLGDRLRFHLLVRYNRLKDSRVAPGTMLRIPGNEPVAAPPIARPRPEPVPPKAAPPAERAVRVPPKPAANPALAAALRVRGLGALNQGRIAEAVVALRRARAADPANAAVQRDLVRAERLLAAVKARR